MAATAECCTFLALDQWWDNSDTKILSKGWNQTGKKSSLWGSICSKHDLSLLLTSGPCIFKNHKVLASSWWFGLYTMRHELWTAHQSCHVPNVNCGSIRDMNTHWQTVCYCLDEQIPKVSFYTFKIGMEPTFHSKLLLKKKKRNNLFSISNKHVPQFSALICVISLLWCANL